MVFFSLLSYTTIFDAIRPNVQNALFREVCSAGAGQTALFRHVAATECAFP